MAAIREFGRKIIGGRSVAAVVSGSLLTWETLFSAMALLFPLSQDRGDVGGSAIALVGGGLRAVRQ